MTILFNNDGQDAREWVEYLTRLIPTLKVHQYPDIPDRDAIKYAVVWNHPAGELSNYPNLKAVLNLGAGTDWLEADPALPKVPIVRLLDPAVGIDMANYVLYWVLHFHRGFTHYREQQKQNEWYRFQVSEASKYRVTVLGLGLIGTFIAKQIHKNGYRAQAWNRSRKEINGIETYQGESGLGEVLAISDVLVNCLPHNEATNRLLDYSSLSKMPKAGYLINVSRGGVVDHADLIKLLDEGHLAGAALDAFDIEPLPRNSPLWQHAKVEVTPHMSGATYPNTSAKVIAENILRMERGEQAFPIYPNFVY